MSGHIRQHSNSVVHFWLYLVLIQLNSYYSRESRLWLMQNVRMERTNERSSLIQPNTSGSKRFSVRLYIRSHYAKCSWQDAPLEPDPTHSIKCSSTTAIAHFNKQTQKKSHTHPYKHRHTHTHNTYSNCRWAYTVPGKANRTTRIKLHLI